VRPDTNFEARDYFDAIDWEKEPISPPPLLRNVPNDQLCNVFVSDLPFCPTNTQSVERVIAIMSKVASTTEETKRDGSTQLTLESLKAMPKFSTKKDFATRQLQ